MNFPNVAPELYQISMLFATTKKLRDLVESMHFLTFSANAKSSREAVMESEMVMEKSWKNILSSMWEPC